MKKNDTGDFSVFYVEPDDERDALFQAIAGQHKTVVLMLAEQTRIFQRPDDFTTLKLAKRRHDLTIIFVVPHAGQSTSLAMKNGFPVYQSMDQLAEAIRNGLVLRQRTLMRPTVPLDRRSTSPLAPQAVTGSAADLPVFPQGQSKPSFPARPVPEPVVQPEQNSGALKYEPSMLTHTATPATSYTFSSNSTGIPGLGAVTQPLSNNVSGPLPPLSQGVSVPLPPLFSGVSAPLPPLSPQSQPAWRRQRLPLLTIVLTIAVVSGLIGSFLVFPHIFQVTHTAAGAAPADASVGRVTYVSSEQLSESSNQGISDELAINLQGLRAPAAGKKYYAWLLGDRNQSDPVTVALGALTVNQGKVNFTYPGNAQHTNLLVNTNRFLITEEDAAVPPMAPSPDAATWRYYGEFSSTPIKSPNNPQNYSYVDHLRHLLADDPTLDLLQLPGGLNTWFYRNTGKLVEWSTSMRESWEATKDAGYVRRQTTRILTYLDGTTFLYRDLPAKQPLLVEERLARVGLLNVTGPGQEPASYMDHIDRHLNGLLQADATPQALRAQIGQFTDAMSNIELWLKNVRSDAQKIVKMSDAQLRQPGTLALLNDMIGNINNAFAGQLDPTTGQTREGVSWLHDHINALAALDITPVKANASGLVPQTAPAKGPVKA